ncbi:hypothetical protein ABZY09_36100 [Streptomyces sp. NPDC002928]|uniref:hypothetical protein n=1 Tax=Streptomyces sp. NPDC002928 TaxID=3154440 RepID=UPI0033AB63C3
MNTLVFVARSSDQIRPSEPGWSRFATTSLPASTTKRQGWLGEVEGLQVSLAGAAEKLTQLDRRRRTSTSADLGIPHLAEPLTDRRGEEPP